MNVVEMVGTYGIHLCTVLSITFVTLYCWWANPWRTEFGRLILFSNTVLGLLFLFLSIRIIFREFTFLMYLRLILFLCIPIYLAWQIWLLYRIQRKGRQ